MFNYLNSIYRNIKEWLLNIVKELRCHTYHTQDRIKRNKKEVRLIKLEEDQFFLLWWWKLLFFKIVKNDWFD